VWSVARSCRLDQADAADVSQTTWLRLAEHLDKPPHTEQAYVTACVSTPGEFHDPTTVVDRPAPAPAEPAGRPVTPRPTVTAVRHRANQAVQWGLAAGARRGGVGVEVVAAGEVQCEWVLGRPV